MNERSKIGDTVPATVRVQHGDVIMTFEKDYITNFKTE